MCNNEIKSNTTRKLSVRYIIIPLNLQQVGNNNGTIIIFPLKLSNTGLLSKATCSNNSLKKTIFLKKPILECYTYCMKSKSVIQ